MIRVVLATLLALMAVGCNRRSFVVTPMLAVRLAHGATEASFDRVLEVARHEGYVVEFSDPVYGVLGLRAHAAPVRSGEPPATLIVHCYGDGHATIEAIGLHVTSYRSARRLPSALAREAVALAQQLDEGVDP